VQVLTGGGEFGKAMKLPERDRERYGSSPTGDALLLALRLANSCAGAVTVCHESDSGWDMHRDAFSRLARLLPPLDAALAALVEDLFATDCVLAVLTEFGRTPRINGWGGRDHWPYACPAVLAGNGIEPGVLGSNDRDGRPRDGSITAADLGKLIVQTCLGAP
jgi:hypothetical protein